MPLKGEPARADLVPAAAPRRGRAFWLDLGARWSKRKVPRTALMKGAKQAPRGPGPKLRLLVVERMNPALVLAAFVGNSQAWLPSSLVMQTGS